MPASFVAIRFDYADYDLDSACAIGLVKVQNGKPIEALYEKFSPSIQDFHFVDDSSQTGGLRKADLEGMSIFPVLWPAIKEFIGDLPLVANSATTYMKTLEILWVHSAEEVNPIAYLCTQVLGRKVTELGSFNLEFYSNTFGYELPEPASALDKSKATAAIMLGLLELSQVTTLDELVKKSNVQWGSVSSGKRISCKSIRESVDPVSKADLQAMRQEFEKSGFDQSHPLFEKHVLLTGTLRKGTRSEVEKLLAEVGAFPELNFTKKTNYLVVGYDAVDGLAPGGKPTSKITKSIEARAAGQMVEVVDEQTFLELLEN
jgi:DNA polymerase-3 subunit epsilon